MVEVLVLFVSGWICVIDIRTHKIPNELSLFIAVLLLCDSVSTQFLGFLLAASICLLVAYVGKVGAGDVKLFLVLVATSGSVVSTQAYFLGMALTSICVLLTSSLPQRLRGIKGLTSIAFAPSILIPFLALYLAI